MPMMGQGAQDARRARDDARHDTSRSSARAVEVARDATAGADAAAQRAEVWRRFEWAVAAVTEPGNPARTEAGWVILRELAHDPWANAQDRAMMGTTMQHLLRRQQTRRTGRR